MEKSIFLSFRDEDERRMEGKKKLSLSVGHPKKKPTVKCLKSQMRDEKKFIFVSLHNWNTI